LTSQQPMFSDELVKFAKLWEIALCINGLNGGEIISP
jgi:hypothetical protein